MTEDEILKLLELIDKAVESDAFEQVEHHAERNGLEDTLVAFATYFGV